MSISPFFQDLRSAYQAEINDLTFDSEGKDVLRQRLAERRKELGFLLQMMELSPEMVAVIFHRGFEFKKPATMDDLLSQEPQALPDWETLADTIVLTSWAQDLSRVILKQPLGDGFMVVAAGLEYMYNKHDASLDSDNGDEADHDDLDEATDSEREGGGRGGSHDGDDRADPVGGADGDDGRAAREREAAGADWLAEQGFDRKE